MRDEPSDTECVGRSGGAGSNISRANVDVGSRATVTSATGLKGCHVIAATPAGDRTTITKYISVP